MTLAQQQHQQTLPVKTVQYNGQVFERIRVLGSGSFGTAIVHRRRADCALVVLKEIDLHKFKRELDRVTVMQEARIMSKLSHKNIIKYHNAYTTETKLIIEMEYARMGTLQSYLSAYRNERPLEEVEIFQIFRQILFGLDYLHSKSIVHLDLKMANIFVTSEGCIKIGDFGIAQFMGHNNDSELRCQGPVNESNNNNNNNNNLERIGNLTKSHHQYQQNSKQHHYQLGTLAYSSPERCLGEPTDFKSDVWSLGCILYELIELRPMFSSESLAELVLSITRIQYDPLQRRDIRPALEAILRRMVAREPQERPSASELICLTDRLLLQLQPQAPLAVFATSKHNQQLFLSSSQEVGLAAQQLRPPGAPLISTINYPHSLVYQVRLSSHDIQVDRVNLPQSKRIREIVRGRSHYLVLTYDSIVYGWGTKHRGQLGACNLFPSAATAAVAANQQRQHQGSVSPPRLSGGHLERSPRGRSSAVTTKSRFKTHSARNSLTVKDLTPFTVINQTNDQAQTQPPSLASSTQTVAPVTQQQQSKSATSLGQVLNVEASLDRQTSKQQHFELLAKSQPATRPIVINELNKRKIVKVAAGNDFSVFLSRTGIVMTCGDGSRGCLGRGDLRSSSTPCMVDALLSMDVVGVACGPEHVMAVCGNGQVYAWGNSRDGRLGLAPERLKSMSSSGDCLQGNYVTIPQLIEFQQHSKVVIRPSSRNFGATQQSPDGRVFIKGVFCGDRCTVFIDSNHQCWACGENRHNKLGLDQRRRFKRSLLVEGASTPRRISTGLLKKHKIVSCSIGRNHASYLTSEGKMLVYGRDIDHSYRLRTNLQAGRNNKRQRLAASSRLNFSAYDQEPIHDQSDYKSLIKSMLASDKLRDFKIYREKSELASKLHQRSSSSITKTSRYVRQQIESYLKRCRSCKKMPFDFVVGMSCTSKFSLALTNNRIYFWGTRTHSKEGSSSSAGLQIAPIGRSAIEPQLVANCSDECFIKIGTTNQSLMGTMQVLGSDQPIIQARNPQLIARSLSELWILDYEPTHSCSARQRARRLSSSDSSSLISSHLGEWSHHGTSCGSGSCSPQSDTTTISSYCSSCSSCCCSQEEDNYPSSQKHDAILEPQPIVSLFVPSMFKQNGCALQLVNLFCFEEDRFFLVLDTTVKFRQHQPSLSAALSSIAARTSTMQSAAGPNCTSSMPTIRTGHQHPTLSSSRQESHSFKHPQESTAIYPSNSNLIQNHLAHSAIDKWRLNKVEESRSSGTNFTQETKQRPQTLDGHHHATQAKSLSSGDELIVLECCRRKDNLQQSYLSSDDPKAGCSAANPQSAIRHCHTNQQTGPLTNSPISCNGFSLEEPRSMSTFVPGFDGNHIAIVGPDLEEQDPETLTRLSFNNYEPSYSNATIVSGQYKQMQKHQRRKGRRQKKTRNKSESTAITAGYEDDTSSMPTWVKNEYMQQMGDGVGVGSITLSTGASTLDVDADAETTEETCLSDQTVSTFGSKSSAAASTLLNGNEINGSDGDYANTDESQPDDPRPKSGTFQEANPSTSYHFQASRSLTSTKSTNCRMSFAISSRLTRSQPNLADDNLELNLPTSRSAKPSTFNNLEDRTNLVGDNLLDCCVYKKHQQTRSMDSNPMMSNAIKQPASIHSRDILHDDSDSVKSRRFIAGSIDSDLENYHEQETPSEASKQKRWIVQSAHHLSGLDSSLLPRSVRQLKVSDMNNNNNEGSLKKGADRRPGQSRTSLSSIRRSLVRIFC